MLSFDHALEDWQDPDNPVTGPRPGPASSIDWWILHYRGVPGVTVPPTLAGIFQVLRNAQHWWTHRPTNRFSLGYNDFLISCEGHPNDGEIIEGRGLRFRGAATGGINDICWATQVIQRDGEPLSPRARARCRERSLELRAVFPLRHGLADHGRSPSTTVTSCAGPGIRADIDAGLLWADEPSPDQEDDDMAELLEFDAGDIDPAAWGPTIVVRGVGPARRVNKGELGRLEKTLGKPRRLEQGTTDHDWVAREIAAYDRYVGFR